MKQMFLPLRKLQWQLSLSYIMVVMVTISALLGVGLVVISLTPPGPPSQQLVQILERDTTFRVMGGLQGDSPNRDWLDAWSKSFIQHPRQFGLNAADTLAVMILDRNGQVITSASVGGMSIDELRGIPESQAIIHTAFADDPHQTHLAYTFADGRTIAAVPILKSKDHLVGVLFVVVKDLNTGDSLYSNPVLAFFLNILGVDQQNSTTTQDNNLPYGIFIILVISIIGIVFGVVTAHRITRRLRRITSAANAWSQGEFQVTVSDRSPDELGQLAQNLNRMAQQVQTLLDTRQELTLMEERQRVARDLHDSVKQHTFAISLLVGAAKTLLPTDLLTAQTYLARVEDLADHTRQELTTILQQLRPSALVEKGLRAGLQDYTRQWSERTGIVVEFNAGAIHSIPLDIEEALFRVAQEALANITRHSQASQVKVQLEQESGLVYLNIHDNGKGFNEAKITGTGQGLANMRERVEAHHGTLSIFSTQDGTLVKACIPLTISRPTGIPIAPAEESSYG